MRRAFSLVELLTVTALIMIIAAALTGSVSRARTRAKISKAEAEMTSIVAEVRTAKDPPTVAAYYEKGLVKDPWGNAYRVTVRRMALTGDGEAENTSAVWYPNAYSPRGDGR